MADPLCDGLCVMASEIIEGMSPNDVAYPHPGCPLHAPGEACSCDYPEKCMSPTHGKISLEEALTHRRRS